MGYLMYQWLEQGEKSKDIIEFMSKADVPVSTPEVATAIEQPYALTNEILRGLVKRGVVYRPYRARYALHDNHREVADKIRDGIKFQNRVMYPVEIWPINKFIVHTIGSARQSVSKKGSRGKRNLEFNLSYKYIKALLDIQNGQCLLSGIPLTTVRGLGTTCPTNLSIDRIDPAVGYIEGNIQLLCWAANLMKGQMSNEEVIMFCRLIVGKQFSDDIDRSNYAD